MFEKFDSKKFQAAIKQAQDPRTIGLIVFAVIVLLVTWSGFKAVERNYELQQQIATLQQQNDIQKLKNENQKLQNEYYNSDQYLELSARQNFGLAAPGEKLLIVPKDVAMSYTKPLPKPKTVKVEQSSQPFFIKNMHAWWNFLLGRQN